MKSKLICKLCKHIWIPRIDCPAACPRCKSYFYMGKKVPSKVMKEAKGLVK